MDISTNAYHLYGFFLMKGRLVWRTENLDMQESVLRSRI